MSEYGLWVVIFYPLAVLLVWGMGLKGMTVFIAVFPTMFIVNLLPHTIHLPILVLVGIIVWGFFVFVTLSLPEICKGKYEGRKEEKEEAEWLCQCSPVTIYKTKSKTCIECGRKMILLSRVARERASYASLMAGSSGDLIAKRAKDIKKDIVKKSKIIAVQHGSNDEAKGGEMSSEKHRLMKACERRL